MKWTTPTLIVMASCTTVLGCGTEFGARDPNPLDSLQVDGAALTVPSAQWTDAKWTGATWRGSTSSSAGPASTRVHTARISRGWITVDGVIVGYLDRTGVLYDAERMPVAKMRSDGQVHSTSGDPLGWVGGPNAALPGEETAWISLGEQGLVTEFDEDGAPRPIGRWQGCGGAAAEACALVTHWILLGAHMDEMRSLVSSRSGAQFDASVPNARRRTRLKQQPFAPLP